MSSQSPWLASSLAYHQSSSSHSAANGSTYIYIYLQKKVRKLDTFHGKCPMILPSFSTATAFLKWKLPGSSMHAHNCFTNCHFQNILLYMVSTYAESLLRNCFDHLHVTVRLFENNNLCWVKKFHDHNHLQKIGSLNLAHEIHVCISPMKIFLIHMFTHYWS